MEVKGNKVDRPKNIIEEAMEQLRLIIVLRRRNLITRKEYKQKLKEIEERLGL